MEVGRYTFTLEDKSRYEVLGMSSGNRYVEAIIYYPINDEAVEGKDKANYISKQKLERIHPLFKKAAENIGNVINLYDNADPSDGKYPVIFFSHGYGGYAEQNQRMIIDLVKTGFIVVSIGHAYEASVIAVDNVVTIPMDSKIRTASPFIPSMIAQNKLLKTKADDMTILDKWNKFQAKYCSFMKGRVKVWADDTLFILNYLKEQNLNEKFILFDKMDFSKGVGATGHSFGGCTSYYLCMNNPDFVCGINIDGGIFGDYEGLNMKPFMQISCFENINVATRTFCYAGNDLYKLLIKNMKHIGLSDGKYLLRKPFYVGKIDCEKMERALFSAHREFFSKYLKGIDTNFEYLEKAVCDEVIFEKYEKTH